MDLFIKPFSVIIFQFDEATKLDILEIYADKNQIKRAFDDKLAYKGIGICISP